jgi:putative endonuclease|tara:strand:+ start:69 stop:551 length:483 start_codon:yes stop_codon:yes gene_type:complete
MALNLHLSPLRELFRAFAECLRWCLKGISSVSSQAERGRYGEWRARQLLRRKGYLVLSVNWRNPHDRRDEIDLICKDREVLVFVEVRARASSSQVSGYDSITSRKRKALLKTCKAYLNHRRQRPEHFRFDVVEVDLPTDNSGTAEIFHHENVALFPPRFH